MKVPSWMIRVIRDTNQPTSEELAWERDRLKLIGRVRAVELVRLLTPIREERT